MKFYTSSLVAAVGLMGLMFWHSFGADKPKSTEPVFIVQAKTAELATIPLADHQQHKVEPSHSSTAFHSPPMQATNTAADAGHPDLAVATDNEFITQLSPEVRQSVAEMANDSADALAEVPHPDGGALLPLNNRFQTVMVAVVNAQGEVEVRDYQSLPLNSQQVGGQ